MSGSVSERVCSRRRIGGVEPLEARAMLTAYLAPIANITSPAALGYQVPLDGGASGLASQTYAVTSTNPDVKATVARGQFLTIAISHASSGAGDAAYSGSMTFQLFEDLTPLTASKIENLVNIGFYTGRNFHRIASGFPDASGYIAQGGSVDGAGGGIGSTNEPGTVPPPTSGYTFPDEFNKQLLFDGTGQLAMANAGPDTNETQFFITNASPSFLNFGYTIFGQMVSGQAIYNDIIHTQLTLGTTTPASTILISSASLSAINPDGVIHVDTTGATQGETGQVTVTATDPTTNTTATRTFIVTVGSNLPPGQTTPNKPFLQLGTSSYTVGAGQSATFQVIGVATTPGDPLTYTVQGGVTHDPFTGASSFTAIPTGEGTGAVNSNGVVTFTPAAGFSGTATFIVGVRDATDRTGSGVLDSPGNFSYHTYTVTVLSSTQSEITSNVYFDPAANGTFLGGPAAGRTVYIDLQGDGKLDPGDPTATTGGSGVYIFAGLTPGTYTVRPETYPGDRVTYPTGGSQTITVAGGQIGQVMTFGIVTPSPVLPLVVDPAPFGSHNPDAFTAEVVGVYSLILGRAPDSLGEQLAVNALKSGVPLSQIASGLLHSGEYDIDVAFSDYRNYLGRSPAHAEVNAVVSALQGGLSFEQLAADLLSSAEFSALHPTDAAFVQYAYRDTLGRDPSSQEQSAVVALINSGLSRASVIQSLLGSREAAVRSVTGLYATILARYPDPAGLTYWVNRLEAGTSLVDEAIGFFGSGEFQTRAGKTVG